jgi:hypothetical protein
MNIQGVQGKKYDLGQKLTEKIILFDSSAGQHAIHVFAKDDIGLV